MLGSLLPTLNLYVSFKINLLLPITFAFSACDTPLGVEDGTIPDNQLTAYSSLTLYPPSQARLNSIPVPEPEPEPESSNAGGWCAEHNDIYQWIQVDFNASKVVSAIVLQGQPDEDQYVKQYKVQYSNNGIEWYFVKNAYNDEDTVRYLHSCLILSDRQWKPALYWDFAT